MRSVPRRRETGAIRSAPRMLIGLSERTHSMMNPDSRLSQRLQSLPTWALILLCLLYCVSPIDLVPFLPIDDLGVAAWTAWTVLKRMGGGMRTPLAGAQARRSRSHLSP